MPEALASEQEEEICRVFDSYNTQFSHAYQSRKEAISIFMLEYLKNRKNYDSIEEFFKEKVKNNSEFQKRFSESEKK